MIHLVGLPHTSLNDETYPACAFTAKAVRWIEILDSLDRQVTAYWGGGEDNAACEVVEILSDDERRHLFGDHVATSLPHIGWEGTEHYWTEFLDRTIKELHTRLQPGDVIALWGGWTQRRIVEEFRRDYTIIEPAVGYSGINTEHTHCVFESYAWMHHVYGKWQIQTGRPLDMVIPNFLRANDFPMRPDGGFALFIGRLSELKGPHVAAKLAKEAGIPLWVAGAGDLHFDGSTIECTDGTLVDPVDEFLGVIGPEKRGVVMGSASVVIVPTQYIEPFGTVHAEALMAGVPVVTTDWGVFTETVVQARDGYRFRTHDQGVASVKAAPSLRGLRIREHAVRRFSMEAVSPMWDEWLELIENGG